MRKLKFALTLFTGYCAGEIVTSAIVRQRLNRAFDNDDLQVRSTVERAIELALEVGAADALADPHLVKQAHDKLFKPIPYHTVN